MKKILTYTIIIILLCFSLNAKASTTTQKRDENNNYGVNKKWTINEKNKGNVLNTYLVDASEKIYDFSDILTDTEEEELYQQILTFTKKYKTDLVILTDNLPYTDESLNEEFAADFYDYNDFGIANDNNYSGILLFRNTYEDDPYYDIYMFGNAQLYISQTRADDILDSIYNDLSNKNYVSGFSNYIGKLTYYYEMGIPREMRHYYVDEYSYLRKRYVVPYALLFVISSVVTLIVMKILFSKNKMVAKKSEAKDYLKNVSWNKREDTFLNSHVTSYTESSSSGSSSGGFSSSSGSSGGGHSSGGGRHG